MMKNLIFALNLLLFCGFSIAQHQDNFSTGKDAWVYSPSPYTNYSTQIYQHAYHASSSGMTIRTFIEFDISTLPDNAVVTSANLKMHQYTFYGTTDIAIHRVDQAWAESGINFSNQSTSIANQQTFSSVSSQTYHNFDVTNIVKNWVHEGVANNGFRIAVANESLSGTKGLAFSSSERLGYQPELQIFYRLPIEFDGTVTHCSNGGSDGSISLGTITEGTGSYSIRWYNSSYSQISTSSTISNLSPGFYVAEIVDNNDSRLNRVKIFLVGEECQSTAVNIDLPENLAQDLMIIENTPTTSYAAFPRMDFGRYSNYSRQSHIKYEFAGVDDIDPQEVEWQFYFGYSTGVGAEDTRDLLRKDFYWSESFPTWNTINKANNVSATSTTVTSYQTVGSYNKWVGDVLSDFEAYIQNPTYYGFQYEIVLKDNIPYTSASNWLYGFSTSNNNGGVQYKRPNLKVVFDVPVCPEVSFANLSNEIKGNHYETDGEFLRFVYDEEYNSNSIDFKILDWDNSVVATDVNFSLPTIHKGENYIELDLNQPVSGLCIGNGMFILQVTDQKGNKKYLRFIHNNSTCPPQQSQNPGF